MQWWRILTASAKSACCFWVLRASDDDDDDDGCGDDVAPADAGADDAASLFAALVAALRVRVVVWAKEWRLLEVASYGVVGSGCSAKICHSTAEDHACAFGGHGAMNR